MKRFTKAITTFVTLIHDVVDKYHTPEQQERGKHSDAYMLAICINDTLDVIDEGQSLLSFNLVACAVILEQFCLQLDTSHAMGAPDANIHQRQSNAST